MIVTNLPKFEIIGHRGNPGNPLNSINVENTVRSFKDAWAIGADGIELDVILSKDGVLMVHHDDALGRVFILLNRNSKIIPRKQKLIGSYTAYELTRKATISVGRIIEDLEGTGSSPTFYPESLKLPTLSDVPIPEDKKLFLELKFINDAYDKASPTSRKYLENLVKKAVEFIEQKGLIDQTYILCFVPEALDRVKELNPKIVTAHNIYQGEASDLEKIKQLKKDFGFEIMNPPFEQATKGAIENIHDAGLRTYPWVWKQSPDKEISEVHRLMLEGAEGAITNQVEQALATTFQYHS